MLNLDNLSVWFGGGRDRVDAVRNASFCVNSGASFGIVGESGSGKSTILRAVMGLIPNWSGTISVDGRPVDKKREKSFYKIAQMVFILSLQASRVDAKESSYNSCASGIITYRPLLKKQQTH